ncbi:hypothetical protein [Mesorhizobium sp.]|uniref:hypothetical protein n=1 Tax=Mesorhizobium sp. TaxID=1871066 RepID=UPI000FE58486|nr:hypothetical protein [Mesorhizobium sp.]RWA73656.1 MAG: hypothetical protein EOQ29_04615 [Mesorhizobium sp.]
MEQAPKPGELFRRNYIRHEALLADSSRARKRVLKLFSSVGSVSARDKFAHAVENELGIDFPQDYGYAPEIFWPRCELSDFLSAITLWVRELSVQDASTFLSGVRRVFAEENLSYEVDDYGGCHFLVDEEFRQLSDRALAELDASRFTAAKTALSQALGSLGPVNQSGKALIRGVFEAVESAFLVVINQPNVQQLNAQAMDNHLKPILLARYTGQSNADDMVDRLLNSFKAWVKSAHPFRHGTPSDQIHEAPIEVAILSATQGMGFLRLLATPSS